MDPITVAIISAITAGVASGTKDVASQAVSDAYGALKAMLRKRLGDDSPAVEAIGKLEKRPTSAGWQEEVQAELAAAEVANEPELVATAERLLEALKETPPGESHVQQAIGNQIAIANRGSTATVNVTQKD